MNKLSWPIKAMNYAVAAMKHSEDPHKKVGACALRHDNSVAGIGYNGPPPGINIDWSDRDERRKFVVHAENNATVYSRPDEIKLLAVTLQPCQRCMTEVIARYKIPTVYFIEKYSCFDVVSELAKTFNVELIQMDESYECFNV